MQIKKAMTLKPFNGIGWMLGKGKRLCRKQLWSLRITFYHCRGSGVQILPIWVRSGDVAYNQAFHHREIAG
jgi:hypothetical protein